MTEPLCLPSDPSSISYKEFSKRISDLETRWINHFEEIKEKPISSNDFHRLELELNCELAQLDVLIMSRKLDGGAKSTLLENKLNSAKNRVLSYKEKSRVISLSKWRDKNRNLIERLLEFFTELIKRIPRQGS